MQSWFHSDNRCFSSPLSLFHLHGFTVLHLQQVSIKRKKKKKASESAMWRQANLKAIIDHQPPWLVWLQCTRCNWLGTALRFFNRKYTLSLSITLKRWQHQGKTKLPEATVWCKNWINCGCQSNSDRRNQARRVSPKLHRHLQSSLKCTTVSVYWASCCEFLETFIKRNSLCFCFLKSMFARTEITAPIRYLKQLSLPGFIWFKPRINKAKWITC